MDPTYLFGAKAPKEAGVISSLRLKRRSYMMI